MTTQTGPSVPAQGAGAGVLVCVDIGGSSVETVLLGPGPEVRRSDGLQVPPGLPLLIAVPGLVHEGRVLVASNLDWHDVDPAEALGLDVRAAVVANDAEAAALGESTLRAGAPDLVYLGLGTGVGGAVVRGGVATGNLFGHGGSFSERLCTCGSTGCLETVAGGWALPTPVPVEQLPRIAAALARAVDTHPAATPRLVVLAGGLARAYPQLVDLLAAALPGRTVTGTAAPTTKSASAWGLRHVFQHTQRP